MMKKPLILGSASPRRHDLMRAAGYDFTIEVSAVEEIHDASHAPEELTVMNASLKACDISARRPGCLVLGADTLVYIDGEPLGKPADHAEAARMLRRLSGRVHSVCTGVCLAEAGGVVASAAVVSMVRFHEMTDAGIARYHELVNPLDKAGAYGMQEHGELLGAEIVGPEDNVIGLPMQAVGELLARHGFGA